MNKSQRIYLQTGDTDVDRYVFVKLEKDVDTLEFMSLKIDTQDAYQDFNADYGVLVGRVIANGGVGIPNAKVSIFIPLEEDDETNSQIRSVYPYKTPSDKNIDGKRYNLLPRVGKINPVTGEIKPQQPFGSFPIKEEIVTNSTFLEVYEKYYKYSTVTNNSGDYMIYGVPTGTQTVHMSVDITDIGKYSMTPAAMVTNLGYSSNLFTDNDTRIKPSNDLTDLPHIETQEISVDVIPFWGDSENFDIGITRQDFRIRATLVNTFVLFGSVFTDGRDDMWAENLHTGRRISELFRASDPAQRQVSIASKRIGRVTEKIFYYPANISDADIEAGNVADDGSDMLLLDPSQYSVYKRDGDFIYIINANRNKIITDEAGNEKSVDNDSADGVFTKFRGFITLEVTVDDLPMDFIRELGNNATANPMRYKLKFPQFAEKGDGFGPPMSSGDDTPRTIAWRKQHKTFEAGKLYSIAKFQPVVYNDSNDNSSQFNLSDGFFKQDVINQVANNDTYWNVGVILSENIFDGGEIDVDNEIHEYPFNSTTAKIGSTSYKGFGANWMNLAIHLPQVGYLSDSYENFEYVRITDHFHTQGEGSSNTPFNRYFFSPNTQNIAAGEFNTQFLARSDIHWTDIIEVPIEDVIKFGSVGKGFRDNQLGVYELMGNYRNGTIIPDGWTAACPEGGGRENGLPTNPDDERIYFYKGFDAADCIQYLFELGIV